MVGVACVVPASDRGGTEERSLQRGEKEKFLVESGMEQRETTITFVRSQTVKVREEHMRCDVALVDPRLELQHCQREQRRE